MNSCLNVGGFAVGGVFDCGGEDGLGVEVGFGIGFDSAAFFGGGEGILLEEEPGVSWPTVPFGRGALGFAFGAGFGGGLL